MSSPFTERQIRVMIDAELITVNELREARGLGPLPKPLGDVIMSREIERLGVWAMDPPEPSDPNDFDPPFVAGATSFP